MITEIDPLFLIIPYLLAARGPINSENKGKLVEYDEIFEFRT